MREFKIDLADIEAVERFEKALKNANEFKPQANTMAGALKEQCQIVRKFFDECFGNGASQERFGDKWNIAEHIEALIEVIDNAYEAVEGLTTKSNTVIERIAARR